MPDALRIGVLGPLQVRDGAGRSVPIGGRQLRVLLILLALDAGRVVPSGSLAGQLWPDDPPGHPGNALQTLVSRLRAELRRAGLGQVIESHPAGYRPAGLRAGRGQRGRRVADLPRARCHAAGQEEAGSFGRKLGAWGDLTYIDGMLAAIRFRMGDLERARADLERAERAAAERSASLDDMGAWLALVRAELHCCEGNPAAAARNCEKVLAWLDGQSSPWWDGMGAHLRARAALVVLAEGDEARSRALLATALGAAAEWVERPALAAVIDAIAVFVLQVGGTERERAALAATLLGAAHAIRGAFDEGSLDAPGARDAARGLLGEAAFEAAYERGRALVRGEALVLAAAAVGLPGYVLRR